MRRNSDPSISNGDLHKSLSRVARFDLPSNDDGTALWRELDSVRGQVHENLLDSGDYESLKRAASERGR